MRINREDMLELTRRMTVKRSSMTRIAGAYMDRDGYVDGTFNTNFLKLSRQTKRKIWHWRKPFRFPKPTSI